MTRLLAQFVGLASYYQNTWLHIFVLGMMKLLFLFSDCRTRLGWLITGMQLSTMVMRTCKLACTSNARVSDVKFYVTSASSTHHWVLIIVYNLA